MVKTSEMSICTDTSSCVLRHLAAISPNPVVVVTAVEKYTNLGHKKRSEKMIRKNDQKKRSEKTTRKNDQQCICGWSNNEHETIPM
jgi:hypothetical protein